MNFVIEIQSEFEYIVRAFQFVASMFSPGSSYIGVLATLGVLGIFFGGISAISAQAMSGKSAIVSWFMNMLIASIVIIAVINNKSNVTIHDTTINQFRVVGGVPTVMAAIAFMENRIENGIKDIISTVMQPILPYEDIGKGKGFELLSSLGDMSKSYLNKYPHIQRSVGEYFDKCALIDLERGWTPKDAVYHSADIWADLKSSTKTHFSVVYTPTDTAGTVYTCAEAWNKINTMLEPSKITLTVSDQCQSEYQDAAAVSTCVTNLDNLVSNFMSGASFSVNLNSVLRSYIVSDIIRSQDGMMTSMLADVNKRNASSSFMAEKMLPRLKGMMYGMIIGLFPLLVGFVWFSPAKTVVFYAGMFLLMLLWGAIDTFLDMQYQNEVFKMFHIMRDQGLGFQQMFDLPNKAADAVSLYGSGRWMALGLATAISGALTGVNTYAISQMGSQMSSSAQGAAAANAGFMDSAGQARLNTKAASDFGQRELADMTPVANWNNLGSSEAMNTTATMQIMNALKNLGMSTSQLGAAQGAANAIGMAENMFGNQGKMDVLGGIGGAAQLAHGKSVYGTSQDKTNLDTMSSIYGDLGAAGRAAGSTGAINTAENISSTQGKLNAAGSVGALLGQASKQGDTSFRQTAGGLDATHDEASALGMSIEDATHLKNNGNILTSEAANALNQKYGTGAFHAGQQISYGVANGALNNVSLRDNIDGASVGRYDVVGGQKEVTLGDNMKAVSSRYSGLINDNGDLYEGSLTTDANGNVVNVSGAGGYSLQNNATTAYNSGVSMNIGNQTMEGLIRGNNATWGGYANINDAQVSELAGYYGKYMSQVSSAESNIKGGIGVKLLNMIGLTPEAYINANDRDQADMMNSAFHRKHDEISNSNMTDTEKAAARAAFHSQVYNEFQEFADSSKLGRMADKTGQEIQGVTNAIVDAVPKNSNDMGMPTDDFYGIMDDKGKPK